MASGRSLRSTVRALHVWLGLVLGLVFAVAGLTGSALVFYPELDALSQPELRRIEPGARPASWEAVYRALQRDHPHRHGAWRIEVTPSGGAIPARLYAAQEVHGERFAPLMAWVDPVSLRTVRSQSWGSYPATWLYDLHYRLCMGKLGGLMMGCVGFLTLLLLLSGLWAWWPSGHGWTKALALKRDAGSIRRLYDVHKWASLAGLGALLLLTGTGMLLCLPDQVRPLLNRTSPLYVTPKLVSHPAGKMLPLDDLVAAARARFPHAELAWIETPPSPTGVVRVNLAQHGEPSRRFPRTNVWLDPYSGRVLAVRDGLRESGGDTVLNWLHPLHSGEAAGPVGRLLTFLAGLLPAVLFATGVLRWRARQAARGRRSGRTPQMVIAGPGPLAAH